MLQDNEIIELYLQRDERAISETADKYGNYCNTIAYNILRDSFDAEECVNDTYLRTWNSIPPTLPRIFRAFLAKITRNLAIDKYSSKNAKKRNTYESSLDELSECLGGRDISEEIELRELGEMISKFLLTESETARRIFLRRYFFGDEVKEIAKSQGISLSAVKTSIHRTRTRLAKFLSEEGIFL